MTLKEAYKILGASKTDSDKEIKSKYKKLLFLHHPDSDPGRKRDPGDDEKIRQIIEAYKKIDPILYGYVDFETEYPKAIAELEAAGINEYVAEVNRQLHEFMAK